ncbi:MAG: hypothetical protein BZY87_10175 [SAR202 cluster bacterium Io17-Chloro-G6]|nr:MAG: hypothetical protein BZY87_10175 [SAR202 cluster bacterium Io17-Chloro-G6]
MESAESTQVAERSFLETEEAVLRQRKLIIMNLKIKLGLLFGSLTILLIVSASLSYLLVKRIDNDVQNLGRVEEPLVEAVVTMEISIGKGSESIIAYSIDNESVYIQEFKEANIEFTRALEEYNSLSRSDEETFAGRRIAEIQTGFEELSNEIIRATDRMNAGLVGLGDDITDIQEILFDQIEHQIDPNTLDGLSKIEAVLSLSIDVDEVLLDVQSYVSGPDDEARPALQGRREEFKEVDALFDFSQLSVVEEDFTGALDAVFMGVVTSGEGVMDEMDELRHLIVQMEDDLENIDRIMGEEIQPLLFAQTARRLIDAEASVDVAVLAAFILIGLGAVVGVGAAAVVVRQIVNPIVRLTDAAVGLGKGDLGVRADVESRDEIGILADSFNQMAAARQQGEEDLKAAQDEILRTEKLAVIGQWSGGIAHDLRNPIGAIKSAGFMIKKGLISEGVTDADNKLGKYVEVIDQQVIKSNQIITDLMTFVKTGTFALTETDLNLVLEESLETLVKHDNIELSREANPDLSPVMADGGQLQRVFLNLANNAQEAMPGGGVLTVSAKNVNNRVEINFTDTGEGISEENIGKVFDPLFTRKAQGTGLGLAVCQEIIQRHGGTIAVRQNEEPSGGTVFQINLPVAVNQC